MTDERLEKLGLYFTHFAVQERYGISFEQFVTMVDSGRWADMMVNNYEVRNKATNDYYYQTKGMVIDVYV